MIYLSNRLWSSTGLSQCFNVRVAQDLFLACAGKGFPGYYGQLSSGPPLNKAALEYHLGEVFEK